MLSAAEVLALHFKVPPMKVVEKWLGPRGGVVPLFEGKDGYLYCAVQRDRRIPDGFSVVSHYKEEVPGNGASRAVYGRSGFIIVWCIARKGIQLRAEDILPQRFHQQAKETTMLNFKESTQAQAQAQTQDRNLFYALNPNTVKVECFYKEDQKLYTYIGLKSMGIVAGDYVAVESASPAGMSVVQVKQVIEQEVPGESFLGEFQPGIVYKWITAKLDLAEYLAVKQRAENFYKDLLDMERKKKKAEIKEAIILRLGEDPLKLLSDL